VAKIARLAHIGVFKYEGRLHPVAVCSFQSFKMAQTLTLALGFLSAVQALPSWKNAEVKRGAADVAKEYDYIVGKYSSSRPLGMYANTA
jgi:hypothetical protein